MKKGIFGFILVLVSTVAFGQCPNGGNGSDVFLQSQAAINEFPALYPNCASVGYLTIHGDDIQSLDSLYLLTELIYSLSISVKRLKNLEGLHNIETTGWWGSLSISGNDSLTDISQLHGLSGYLDMIEIKDNKALVSLNGLQNIEEIDSPWGLGLRIINNDNLLNLEGLEGIKIVTATDEDPGSSTPIMNVIIQDNDALTNFEGLGHIENQFNMLIENNASLPNVDGLQNQDSIHTLIVKNNNTLIDMSGCKGGSSITFLSIDDNDSLVDLDALDSLLNVEELVIRKNKNLKDITSLPDFTENIGIASNDNLTDLTAFIGLTEEAMNNIFFWDNDTLSSLLPLGSITRLSSLIIGYNKSLTNLAGLDSLRQIDFQLTIQNNQNLADITALHQLGAAEELIIEENLSLTSLIGFAQDTAQFKHVTIKDNLNLPVCDAESICNFLQNFSSDENTVEINNNFSGCNSRAEVEAACMIIGTTELIKDSPFIQLSPNPAFSYFEIKFLTKNQVKLEDIRIFNGVGKLVYAEKMDAFSHRIDVLGWAKGLYVVLVNGKFTEKVLID